MALLSVNMESMQKDVVVDIPPYGLFKNKHVYEVERLEKDTDIGPHLDHKTVLKDPNRSDAVPEPVEMVGASTGTTTVEQEELKQLEGLSDDDLKALAELNKDGA